MRAVEWRSHKNVKHVPNTPHYAQAPYEIGIKIKCVLFQWNCFRC